MAAAVLWSTTAELAGQGHISSGTYWLQRCSGNNGMGHIDCTAYLFAIAEFNSTLPRRLFCPPPEATIGQLQAVVLKDLRDNPATLHKRMIVLALGSLAKAFPCR
jgi:hypothetical protein